MALAAGSSYDDSASLAAEVLGGERARCDRAAYRAEGRPREDEEVSAMQAVT
jgi:hypothetical protein